MKVLTSVIAIALLTTALAGRLSAQSDKAAAEKAIVANEQKVQDAIAKGDVAGFKALVSSDAWSVDSAGPMPVSEFEKNLKLLKLEPGYKISDTKVLWMASNTAVLTYKWTGKGTFKGQPVPPVVYASTVWHRNGDKWTALFHQESVATPAK